MNPPAPLRINITTGPFYPSPPAPCGAVERIWFDLAREFVAAGHKVTILSRGHEGFHTDATVDGILIRRLWTFAQSHKLPLDLLKDLAFSARVAAAIPAADVTVCNCFWLPAMLTRMPWTRAGKVYVSVARVPKGQMKLYTGAARLHAVSTAIAGWIIEQTPAAKPITKVIPNPIDVTEFKVVPTPPPPAPTILFTGRVHPEKGLHLLVAAWDILRKTRPALRLRVIGPSATDRGGGGPDFVASLRKIADAPEFVIDAPIYDRPRLAAALREATVYCYPSVADKGEASPVAPLEAMGVGLVPVCSDMPQFRDYLDEGVNGVTFDHRPPDAPQKLATALAGLLDDPARLARMGAAAATTAAQYSNAAIARRFMDDFASLVTAP